jgi:transcriptional regulator with XRE-family HTH domain
LKSEIKYQFGGKIREVRERKNITLKDVAALAGVSESLVSQIERNKVSPSIDTLLTIADVLGIDHEFLFSDYKKSKKVSVLKAATGSTLVQGKVTQSQLSRTEDLSEDHSMEAFMLEIEAGGEKGDMEYGHAGKELGFILDGSAELVYGAETYLLEKGDTVSFPSDIPHILRNTGGGVLKALWIITPPRLIFARK